MESKRFTLNQADVRSIGRGLLINVAGAIVVYLAIQFAKWDFGAYTPLAVAVSAALVNVGRKLMEGE